MIEIYRYVISNMIFNVKKGVKLASMEPIPWKYEKEAEQIIEDSGLKHHAEWLCDDWVTLWAYEDELVLDIIKCLPKEATTPLDHYVLGKMFGYSNEKILEFIRKQK